MVAVTGTKPVFTAIKVGMLPVPDAIKPILGVSFDQLYDVVPPVFVLLKDILGKLLPLHIFLSVVAFTLALGETVIVNCFVLPVQEVAPTR